MEIRCDLARSGCEEIAVGAYRLEGKLYTSFCANCWRAVRDVVILSVFGAVPLELDAPLPTYPQAYIHQ